MDKLPISVIVPFSIHRDTFFHRYCLPSIEANNPHEIIVEDGEGSAPYKRNLGAKKATQDYLFFCDDDSILANDCLKTMYFAIDGEEEGFAYSHYIGIVNSKDTHPIGKNFVQHSHPFSLSQLKKNNYIDTMSLVKTKHFPGFDEELVGFQDWDLWLRVAEQGVRGEFINDVLFIKFYFDQGISSDPKRHMQAKATVKKKHGIN